MNRLALARAGFGAAVLIAPDEIAGHLGDLRLDHGSRTVMRILGLRLLAQAAICAARPTRCVLAMEGVVDAIHAATMGAVALGSHDDGHRRAAAANVVSASAFVAVDIVATRRHRQLPDSPGNPVLRWRDMVAERLCHLVLRWSPRS